MASYKPDWMKEEEWKYWSEYRAAVLALTDYYCPDCGRTRLQKKAGENATWCRPCLKFRNQLVLFSEQCQSTALLASCGT